MILVGSFQLTIFQGFQDILCPTCWRLPAQEDQVIITTPKAFLGFLAGWGGKLWCSHLASQGTAGTQSWGELPAPQSWAGREGTHSQKPPEFSSRNIQGTPEQSQIPWRRVPTGNHSCPCSGRHCLAGKWLFPKSPCSSMTCTWRFWSPQPWNFSRLDHPALAEGVGLDDIWDLYNSNSVILWFPDVLSPTNPISSFLLFQHRRHQQFFLPGAPDPSFIGNEVLPRWGWCCIKKEWDAGWKQIQKPSVLAEEQKERCKHHPAELLGRECALSRDRREKGRIGNERMAQGSSEPSVPHPVPPEEPQICTCGTWQAALPCRAGGSSCWSGAAEPPWAGGSCAPAPADIPSGPARSGSCSSSGHPHTCKTNPVRAERHPCYRFVKQQYKNIHSVPLGSQGISFILFFGTQGSAEPPAVQGQGEGVTSPTSRVTTPFLLSFTLQWHLSCLKRHEKLTSTEPLPVPEDLKMDRIRRD